MAKKGYTSTDRPIETRLRGHTSAGTTITLPDGRIIRGTIRIVQAGRGYRFETQDGPDIQSGLNIFAADAMPGFPEARKDLQFPGGGAGDANSADADPYGGGSERPARPGAPAENVAGNFAANMRFRTNEAGELELVPLEPGSASQARHRTILDDPIVEAAVVAVLERVPEIVRARQEALSQDNIDLLVDAYLKSAPTAPARHEIEMDNARERARFVEDFPCYTSREVAELAGHEAVNASATATRWKKARRILGLPWKGGDLYPAFQFHEGRPRPIIARLIEALPGAMSPWQIAFWLTSSNSWLGGDTPLDRLDDEAALIAAASRESEALGG